MAAGERSVPEEIFRGDYLNVDGRSYDVAKDGRFLVLRSRSTSISGHLNVVANWFEELKRLVPTEQ